MVRKQSAAKSTIIHYNIFTTLKSTDAKKVHIDNVDVEFDTRPRHNNEDIISNIKIVKPSNNFAEYDVKSDDHFSVLFSINPLTEIGALMLSNLS